MSGMAVQAKYTAPLQVPETPEKRDRVNALATKTNVSQAQIVRDALDIALPVLEERHGLGRV